jgi:phospholipase C
MESRRDPLGAAVTRRDLLAAGGGIALGAAVGGGIDLSRALAAGLTPRPPDTLPDPSRPAGTATAALPFDHVVIVMQENHSFDSYLGMLPRRGQPLADGLTFDARGVPINSNPYKGGYVTVQHVPSDCTLNGSGSQSWSDTHRQIDGGKMDGFAATGVDSMAYWDQSDLPFYYSLARTFCLANRWFCSAPCQTYPNRRFLQAGTAFGLISTDTSSVTQSPPNGTIWDRLHSHNVTWANYFTEVPTAAIIFETVTKYPLNMVPIARFYTDCAAGTLPAVSMVDSGIGGPGVLAGLVGLDYPPGVPVGLQPGNIDQDEENGNVSEGENFVSRVVQAVLHSPLWPRILLVWLYDEHGGNYDHVPPPRAIAPDAIAPRLGPKDPPGGYDIYGPRVPAVVVSGHAKPHAVTNVVHDHTSVLATIEAKWNLPAMTYRDANATTLSDFLVTGAPSFPEPPALAAPSNESQTQLQCDPGPLDYPVSEKPPTRRGAPPKRASTVELRVLHSHHAGTVLIGLRSPGRTVRHVEIELERGHRVLARAHLHTLGPQRTHVRLRHHPLHPGRYTFVVKVGGRVVVTHTQHLTTSEV